MFRISRLISRGPVAGVLVRGRPPTAIRRENVTGSRAASCCGNRSTSAARTFLPAANPCHRSAPFRSPGVDADSGSAWTFRAGPGILNEKSPTPEIVRRWATVTRLTEPSSASPIETCSRSSTGPGSLVSTPSAPNRMVSELGA